MRRYIEFLRRDEVMERMIKKSGELSLSRNFNYFQSLAENMIYQQLNGKAAKTIYKRFLALFPGKKPTPELLIKIEESDLQSVGLSRQKRGYLYSLAEKFLDSTLTHANFCKMSDDEVINELIQIKGIGKWTAQMFLMFSLARKDVFAQDDFGLRKSIQLNYDFEEMPSPKQAEKFAEKWKPYRSYASLYLWKSKDK